MAPGVEMAEQHGWMLHPESGNGSLLFCQQECQWIDVRSFGREVRVLDGRCVYSLPCTCPRIDFHSLDFSLVLADAGVEKARKACKGLRLYDMFTVAMTQQALLMEHTDGSSCASAVRMATTRDR